MLNKSYNIEVDSNRRLIIHNNTKILIKKKKKKMVKIQMKTNNSKGQIVIVMMRTTTMKSIIMRKESIPMNKIVMKMSTMTKKLKEKMMTAALINHKISKKRVLS
jgi:hypothetical protein